MFIPGPGTQMIVLAKERSPRFRTQVPYPCIWEGCLFNLTLASEQSTEYRGSPKMSYADHILISCWSVVCGILTNGFRGEAYISIYQCHGQRTEWFNLMVDHSNLWYWSSVYQCLKLRSFYMINQAPKTQNWFQYFGRMTWFDDLSDSTTINFNSIIHLEVAISVSLISWLKVC